MSRSMLELEQELVAMWQLVNELSEQLATNRELTETLQAQAKDLKGQAVHSGTGFPLRRFNIDISDEQFTSELESFASHLVLENQSLQFENKQLNLLLKEYEGTLEGVMGKFRAVSHAASQHELTLHQYYTSLLHQLRTAYSTTTLLDSTTLSTLLERLSTLLRAALRNANGELPSDSGLPEDLAAFLGSSTSSSPSSTTHPRLISGIPSFNSTRSRAWLGDLGTSGGYAGTEGRADWALEREAEITRLNEENRLLREMLGIGADVSEGEKEQGKMEDEKMEERRVSPGPESVPAAASVSASAAEIVPATSPASSTTSSSPKPPQSLLGSLPSIQPQTVDMVRSISSPPATLDSSSFLSSLAPMNTASSAPTSPPASRARSPPRSTGRSGLLPPPALSPPVIKTPIPLPTLGHAAGESISPSGSTSSSPSSSLMGSNPTSPTNPISSIFHKPSPTSSSNSSSSSSSISPSSSIAGLSTIPGISTKKTKTEATTAMSGGSGGGGLEMLDGMEGRGMEERGRSLTGSGVGSNSITPASPSTSASSSSAKDKPDDKPANESAMMMITTTTPARTDDAAVEDELSTSSAEKKDDEVSAATKEVVASTATDGITLSSSTTAPSNAITKDKPLESTTKTSSIPVETEGSPEPQEDVLVPVEDKEDKTEDRILPSTESKQDELESAVVVESDGKETGMEVEKKGDGEGVYVAPS